MPDMEMQGLVALPCSEMRLAVPCLFSAKAIVVLFIALLNFEPVTIATSAFGGNETDRLALLAFNSKIVHDPQRVMSSWNGSLHFCEWEGVICGRQHRRVIILDLLSRGLVGSLSPYIGNLSFLRVIRLENNTFEGEIPPEFGRLLRLQVLNLSSNSVEGEIPANLSRCSNLMFLSIGYNKLGGKIPMELASLSLLKKFSIHYNHLTGGIPPSFGNLTSLEILSAANNVLGGSIPDSLGQLKNITVLGLYGNELTGTIPASICNNSFITVFSLANNQLDGSFPWDIGLTLPHLQNFQIWGNKFSGTIPVSLSNTSKLEHIEMHENDFTGKIAVHFGGLQHLKHLNLGSNRLGGGEAAEWDFITSLANCSSLEVLGLYKNRLKGVLPNSVFNLSTQLQALLIGDNQIYGDLPSGLGNLVKLTALGMEYNQFGGTIPADIGQLKKLQRMVLSNNNFSGTIPSSFGNLSLLNELYLENNQLHGTIPSSLGNCKNLILLHLSQNNLTGPIPKQLFDISAMSIALNLAQNHLVGSLPSEIGNLKKLSELDVSDNKLSGEIPSNLGDCTSLENLYMESNFFQGTIPQPLGSLRGLLNFDLSLNNLSGEIPEFLEKFSLKYLNLSFNDFEGEVPRKGIFTNASAVSVEGNNRLCGGISELQLPNCTEEPNEPKKSKMTRVEIIIISTACVLSMVIVLSLLLFCWFKKKKEQQSSGSLLRESLHKVSYQGILRATDGFSSANLVGVGSFSSVYKGFLDQVGAIVAIKVLNFQHQGASKSFLAECKALKNIRHRNLVKIITSCSSVDFQGNDFKALVYEYMPNGSLEKWLKPESATEDEEVEVHKLNLLQRVNISIDVACALDYLHHHCQRPIVHCDLKPSNILLDSDMTARVGDFGLARFLPQLTTSNQSSSVGVRGTIGYTAPEYGLGSEVSTAGDVYSYGILLLEMMTRKKPTDGVFGEGLNLHNFARMALPADRVVEIVDPILLKDDEAEADNNRDQIQGGSRVECLVSMVRIGVACSTESPQDRMDISAVLNELHLVRDNLLKTRTGLEGQ